MKTKHRKIKYPSFERHLSRALRSASFRKAYEEEYAKIRIAHQIIEARRVKKLTQKILAERIGTTQSVVARIEQGRQNVTVGMLSKIARGVGRRLEIGLVK